MGDAVISDKNSRAVVFDLDGTLVFTDWSYRHHMISKTLKDLNVSSFNKAHVNMFWYEADRNTVIKECLGVDPEKFWDTYQRHEDAKVRSRHIRAYGDIEALKALKDNGYRLGLLTAARKDIMELELAAIAKAIGISSEDIFDSIIIQRSDYGYRIKPDPTGLLHCLEEMEVSKYHADFVGNGMEDVLAAKNADVKNTLIMRGEYALDGSRADRTIKSLNELL